MYIEIAGIEFYCEVDYEYIRGSKGAWCDGVQVDPDESSTVEITKIMMDYGEDKQEMVQVDLPPQVVRILENEILEEHEA